MDVNPHSHTTMSKAAKPLPSSLFATWLSSFSSALCAEDFDAVAATFLPHGWYRDILTFTWDLRALRGPSQISEYLRKNATGLSLSNIRPDDDPYLMSHFVPGSEDATVEGAFRFETPIAYGRGYVQLAQGADSEWYGLLVCMTLTDLKGYEEPRDPPDWEAAAQGRPYGELAADRRKRRETDPYVLIVGAGQSGLQVAARFDRMNISTLLIERDERVGDVWRKRYDSLALHTPKRHHGFLYQPFPENWPEYTPRDKLADWMEAYAITQELAVWTKSTLAGQPKWDPVGQRWNVRVNRSGTLVDLRPAHIVMATGVLGTPRPTGILDEQLFSGAVVRADEYKNARSWVGKDVVVVGAGNSSIDICQDAVFAGANSVTMVQRSSTCVTARKNIAEKMGKIWVDGVPQEVGDFVNGSVPLGMMKEYMISHQEETWATDRELHDKLRGSGLSLTLGPEGQGQYLLVFERAGGYWLDKGGADMIQSGAIKVKQGVSPRAFTRDALIFMDGSELKADVVVLATGYQYIRETSTRLLGKDVIDRTTEIWGLDSEGELRGSYRPSGHPGLWFAASDFFQSRYMSKHLALQIKARELGYVRDSLVASL